MAGTVAPNTGYALPPTGTYTGAWTTHGPGLHLELQGWVL